MERIGSGNGPWKVENQYLRHFNKKILVVNEQKLKRIEFSEGDALDTTDCEFKFFRKKWCVAQTFNYIRSITVLPSRGNIQDFTPKIVYVECMIPERLENSQLNPNINSYILQAGHNMLQFRLKSCLRA